MNLMVHHLTLNNWTYETGTGDGGWGNQEWQTYTAGDNAKVENGILLSFQEWNGRMVTTLHLR